MGLRLKFNLVIVPLVALMTAAMVWLDYRHELVSVTASHEVHGGVGGAVSPLAPVRSDSLP